jgi:hypothetical protein
MSHICPNCQSECHCCGDIDDINFGEWDLCECDCELERLNNPEDEPDYPSPQEMENS